MFSTDAKRRSDDGVESPHNHDAERTTLLAALLDDRLEPGRYYADLGFRPPGGPRIARL